MKNNKVFLLFKKDFIEKVSVFRQKGVKKDILGMLSSILLLGVIFGVFIFVFYSFAKMYVGTTFGDSGNEMKRLLELTTLVYAVVIVLNTVMGTKKIHSSVCDAKDGDVLIAQPISAWSIFFYKLIKVYFSQFFTTILVLVPATIAIDIISPLAGGGAYYLLMIFSVILVPFISSALSAVLSIPFTAIMRLLESHFILHLAVYVVLIGAGFFLYSIFLTGLSEILQNGEIAFLFDSNAINTINKVTTYLYPSNLFANMLFKTKVWQSILITLGIVVVCGAITYFIVQNIYNKILQQKLQGSTKVYRGIKRKNKYNVVTTLLHKEFVTVLRTPSYAFQYFATTFTLPFMVYVCANLIQSMMKSITVLDCNFAVAIFVISMFSILTNSFCTINISRDGRMFSMLKTMPITVKEIVGAKILFCMAVSAMSVLASAVVLCATGILNWWQGIFIFCIGIMLSFAEIAYSTKKDLKNPAFPSGEIQEITESNANTSAITLVGLLLSIVAGGGAVGITAILSIVSTQLVATLVSVAFVFLIVAGLFVASILYLRKDIEKVYYNLEK